ncbi:MAG: hypothetical protein WA996_19425, partial [Candidatus Promineifilaceae bacterium]
MGTTLNCPVLGMTENCPPDQTPGFRPSRSRVPANLWRSPEVWLLNLTKTEKAVTLSPVTIRNIGSLNKMERKKINESRSRLALLATLSDLHREPVNYDLDSLRAILTDLAPDLLCAEITREIWEGDDLSKAAGEVREALVPVVEATDVVLVPVAPNSDRFADFAPEVGWRRGLVQVIDRALRWGQRQANTPEAINGKLFEMFCHPLCRLTEMSWTAEQRRAWDEQNRLIAD